MERGNVGLEPPAPAITPSNRVLLLFLHLLRWRSHCPRLGSRHLHSNRDRDLIRPFPKPDPARESRIGHERPFPAIRLWYAHSRLRTSLGTLRSVQHDSRINPHRQMVPVSAPDGNGSLSPICPKAVVRLPGHTANMSTIRHVRKSTSSTLV